MQMRLVDKTVLFKRNKKGEAEKLTQKIIRLGQNVIYTLFYNKNVFFNNYYNNANNIVFHISTLKIVDKIIIKNY